MAERTEAPSLNSFGVGFLPGLIGIRLAKAERGLAVAELEVRKELLAPNGYLHAGTVVTLADTACGVGCLHSLPEGASGFTTIELKANFLGTAVEGRLDCRAIAEHLGKATQLWDAVVVRRETGKTIALFRCTQMILRPKP